MPEPSFRKKLLAGLLSGVLTLVLFGAAPAPAAVSLEIGKGVGQGAVRPEVSPAREAFEARRSRVWLEVRGWVDRILRDDLKGERHQRFILRLADGLTVLVSHNIDLAPRVPVRLGDEVQVRGRYEWNKKGGVIHWTHDDPKGRLLGGWIRHEGRLYR